VFSLPSANAGKDKAPVMLVEHSGATERTWRKRREQGGHPHWDCRDADCLGKCLALLWESLAQQARRRVKQHIKGHVPGFKNFVLVAVRLLLRRRLSARASRIWSRRIA
jgi:hypothetical protein